MASNLKGKVALVTGGGSGIGKATAMTFAREGAKIAIADYVPEGGERTVKEITAAGGEAIFIHTDVSVGRQVEAMVNKIVQTWGRLDCAHNNAGIEGRMANTAECTEENFDRTIAINLKGVWLCMKYEIPQMLKHGGGAIVKTAALEYAQQGIRVNAVCPGVIRTPMVARLLDSSTLETYTEKDLEAGEPVGRMGKPEEIAEAVVWLCSDAASFVTGLPMAVDGGWIAQ